MFTLKIETDNAAFGDIADEACTEVARMLRVIAGGMEAGNMSGQCRDVNGNTVGHYDLTGD